jgi:NADPH-dependent ferric siderophore reductase
MARRTTTVEVRRTERLTPHMVRVVFGGADVATFPDTEHTDRYVKLQFPMPGVRYPEPFDVGRIRAELPREQRPSTRTYTVRALDHATGELTVDFVHHGDDGLAGPWAAAARPGDLLRVTGPGGAYAPDPTVDAHLMVGDESALPAIGAACERVAPGVPVLALLEVGGEQEHQAGIRTPDDLLCPIRRPHHGRPCPGSRYSGNGRTRSSARRRRGGRSRTAQCGATAQ